jgi:hypothetical protein
MKRQARQARHLSKPKVREAKRAYDREYYQRNKDRIKTGVRVRQLLEGDPQRMAELQARFRIVGPGEAIPPDASLTTRNACPTNTNTRGDTEYILEGRYPAPDGPWGFITAAPDLSTLLGLGGKRENPDLKEFIRDEMLRRFPERYPHRDTLPTEDDILLRDVGPPDRRETEKRVAKARIAQLTPEFQCPNDYCDYLGPMLPTGKGPYLAEHFLVPDTQVKMGAQPSDLLPGVYCPQCRSLVLFPAGSDVGRPIATGNENEYRCECGFTGRPAFDPARGEYTCAECGLVVGETLDVSPPRRKSPQ